MAGTHQSIHVLTVEPLGLCIISKEASRYQRMREKDMDQDVILKMCERAKVHARANGYPQDADDFSQEVYIALARGRKATIDQLFVDYLRGYYGDTRSSGGELRSFEHHGRCSASDPETEDYLFYQQSQGSNEELIPSPGDDRRIRAALSPKLLLIYECLVDHFMPATEIAGILCVSESRVSQLAREVEQESQKALIVHEYWAHYKNNRNASKLEVSWIQI